MLLGTSGSGNAGKEAAKQMIRQGIKGIKGTEATLKTLEKGTKVRVVKDAGKNVEAGFHGHHANPKFMGGHQKQDLVEMLKSRHVELHRDLVKFLQEKYPEMVTKPGYDGFKMQRAVEEELRLQAMKEFYTGPGAKYGAAAKEFFKQIPK